MKRPEGDNSVHLLRRLARDLRYRALPDLVGRTVEPAALNAVEPALRWLVAAWLASDAKWLVNSHLEGALAKYGLIDTAFVAPAALLDHPSTEVGASVLRANGFVPEAGGSRADAIPEFEDPTCLEELAQDIDEGTCLLKVFLQDEVSFEARIAQVKTNGIGRLPADYFPRRLTVVDACVTNAGFVWFHKHFYM